MSTYVFALKIILPFHPPPHIPYTISQLLLLLVLGSADSNGAAYLWGEGESDGDGKARNESKGECDGKNEYGVILWMHVARNLTVIVITRT